jgi:hypothetical protein
MGKTSLIACPECGAENEVLLSEGTFEDNLRRASFSFACRVCGATLPDEAPRPADAADAKPESK